MVFARVRSCRPVSANGLVTASVLLGPARILLMSSGGLLGSVPLVRGSTRAPAMAQSANEDGRQGRPRKRPDPPGDARKGRQREGPTAANHGPSRKRRRPARPAPEARPTHPATAGEGGGGTRNTLTQAPPIGASWWPRAPRAPQWLHKNPRRGPTGAPLGPNETHKGPTWSFATGSTKN